MNHGRTALEEPQQPLRQICVEINFKTLEVIKVKMVAFSIFFSF